VAYRPGCPGSRILCPRHPCATLSTCPWKTALPPGRKTAKQADFATQGLRLNFLFRYNAVSRQALLLGRRLPK